MLFRREQPTGTFVHYCGKSDQKVFAAMKTIMPIVFALIPLAAVVSACVAVP